jgi:hypothetical protein
VIGDILSVVIGPEGYYAEVTFEGLATGGTYNLGLTGADAEPSGSTPSIVVTSEGYDATGTLGTITRTVYLTRTLRLPYPADPATSVWENVVTGISGSNLVVRVALSEFIYVGDWDGGTGTSGTNPQFSAPSGILVQGGHSSSAISGLTVVNNSTRTYAAPEGEWSRPDRFRLTGNSVTLGMVCAHGHPRNRRPVACVKFTATAPGGYATTQTLTAPEIDGTYGDATPVIEYVAALDLTSFPDDVQVTCNFKAYPWVGDETAVLDTLALGLPELNRKSPQFYTLDRDGSRGYPMAVVDPSTGTDPTATSGAGLTAALAKIQAADGSSARTTAAASPFRTVGAAIDYMAAYRSANSGNRNAQGGTIYMRAGTHTMMGRSPSTSLNTSAADSLWTWLNVLPYPADGTVTINPDGTANSNRTAKVSGIRFKNLVFQRAADRDFVRAGALKCVFEDCAISDTRPSNTYQYMTFGMSQVWILRGSLTRVNGQQNGPWFRGVSSTEFATNSAYNLIIGLNVTAGATAQFSGSDIAGKFIGFNRFWKIYNPWYGGNGTPDGATFRGGAMVQNVVEFEELVGQPGCSIAPDQNQANTYDFVAWHNGFYGQRCNWFYNANGIDYHPHFNHSLCLNWFEYFANKGDQFAGGASGGGANANRIGNWAVSNGVHTIGNRVRRGAYDQRFGGILSRSGDDTTKLEGQFVDNAVGAGTDTGGTGLGHGNYHPTSSSPILSIPLAPMFDWDVEGVARQSFDAAGPYIGPTSGGGGGGGGTGGKKAAGFFAA